MRSPDSYDDSAAGIPTWILPAAEPAPIPPPETPTEHLPGRRPAADLITAATPAATLDPTATTLTARDRRTLVRRISTDVANDLNEQKATRKKEAETDDTLAAYTRPEERELARNLITDYVQRHVNADITAGRRPFGTAEQQVIEQGILDTLFGLGPVQPVVDHPDVEDIFINGVHCHSIDSRGDTTDWGDIADTDDEVIDWITNLAARAGGGGRTFSQMNPHLRLNLDGGIRFTADAWTTERPHVALRLHRHKNITLDDCVGMGTMPHELAHLIGCGIRGGMKLIYAGEMGSGKTMHARATANALPLHTRIATVETERELFLDELPGREHNVIAYEILTGGGERDDNGNVIGSVWLDRLLYATTRQRVDVIIVGEVAGKEIINMVKAMQYSKGSICTTHALTARGIVDRLSTLATEDPNVSREYATEQLVFYSDLLIHLTTDITVAPDGTQTKNRFIDEVVYVEPGEEGRAAFTTIYRRDPTTGTGDFGSFPGPMMAQLRRGGYDPNIDLPPNTLRFEEAYR